MPAIASMMSDGANVRPFGTIAAGRMASAIDSTPQMPHPVGSEETIKTNKPKGSK
jgi:hypothetical protein